MVGAHGHELQLAFREIQHLQGAGMLQKLLNLILHHPLGIDEHVDGHVFAAEELDGGVAVGRGEILVGTNARDLHRRLEQRVADLARHHVHFVAVRCGDQQVGVFRAGGQERIWPRGMAVNRLQVQPVLQFLQARAIGVHHRDIHGLAGQVNGQRPTRLPSAKDEYLHGRILTMLRATRDYR